MTQPGYLCWTCHEQIPAGEEVWLDRWARVVDWSGRSGMAIDPAAYHPTCQRTPDPNPPGEQEPIEVFHQVRVEPKPRVAVEKKRVVDSFDLMSLPKPQQMGLFEEE